MKRLHFQTHINASPEKIWLQLWGIDTYPLWMQPFCRNTYIEGDIYPGAKVRFLESRGEGMFSKVGEYLENEYVEFFHLGNVSNFTNRPLDDETLKWSGAVESYRLVPAEGNTLLEVSVDTVDDMIKHMEESFPLALQELKRRSEA
jgi:hypothetical protein